MDIKDLPKLLPKEVIDTVGKRGISQLTPPQRLSVEHGLLDGRNFVVSAPTASGKTLIAEMAMMRSVIWDRKKAVYIAPMRALVSEKFSEFKESYPQLKTAMSIGDLDSLDHWLENYDVIFVSTEKFDSLIRHGINWLDSIGCIVFDEIHMIGDSGRGPTLEILITKIRRICSGAQILALSATIGNAMELSEWLDAELVESDYRPIALKKGIEFSGTFFYENDNEEKVTGTSKIPEIRITEDTLNLNKQILVFYSTKRNAEAGAEKLSNAINERLTEKERQGLEELSNRILNALSKPTAQCEKLSKLIKKGAAFHHSGLVNEQRHMVEEAFRRNELKAICATTTLCLPNGEEIIANPEPKAIQDLDCNDKVLSHSGRFKKVIIPTRRKYSGELIKIKPYFQLPMSMTPEHRVLACKREKHTSHHYDGTNKQWWTYAEPSWIEAKNITKEHLVLFPRIKENKNIKKIKLGKLGYLKNQTGVVGRHWTNLKKDFLNLNDDTMEFMGIFIAEGSTGKNGVIKIDINTEELELTEKVIAWFRSLGLRPRISDHERHRRSIVACSKQLSSSFRQLFGNNALNKHIPSDFLLFRQAKLKAMIRGMWLGDGNVYLKDTFGCAEYTTASSILAKQLFMALAKIGYMPTISKKKQSLNRSTNTVAIKSQNYIYKIRISGKQLTDFSSKILRKKVNFQGNRTYNIGKIDDNYYYMPIRGIEKAYYDGEVYNIEVEDDASYVGSFIVHNSLGVNLPAHTVLVRDTTRFDEIEGSEKMSVNVVTQLFGRAGRPKYDKEGRALLIAKSRPEAGDLYSRYMNSDMEPINSKLGMLPVLRTHLLAFVATKFLTSEESITDFLKSTFYGHQYANSRELKRIAHEVLDELMRWGFMDKTGSYYRATRTGERVSELYIDPLSAKWIIDTLPKANDDISILFMACNTIEMRPYVKITDEAAERFMQYEEMLQGMVNYEEGFTFYDPLRPFSTATMLNNWMAEKPEPDLVKEYSTTPGALFAKVTNADWLLYSAMELAKLQRISQNRLLEVRIRVRYGIKRELLDLIRLEQVGRVRARLLYNSGIKTVADLRKEGSDKIVTLLFGKEIAKRILDQVRE